MIDKRVIPTVKQAEHLPARVFFRRALAVLFLPLIAAIAFSINCWLIATIGLNTNTIYVGGEALIFSVLPLAGAILVAIIMNWTVSMKAALRVYCISVIGIFAFFGIVALFETINTKPIIAVENTFKELPTFKAENLVFGVDSSVLYPAKAGILPCINTKDDPCPSIRRTWIGPLDQNLTEKDLQKVLDDSGWTDVKIHQELCDMTERKNGTYPDCSAEGMVGDYKATVRIVKISDHWELRMYLRLPTNVR